MHQGVDLDVKDGTNSNFGNLDVDKISQLWQQFTKPVLATFNGCCHV